jgi:hypothetical protein
MKLVSLPQSEICDVIFLTNTADIETYAMTKKAIASLKLSEENNKFRIIVVESNQNNPPVYDDIDCALHYLEEFNYNKALNLAFEHIQSDYVYVSNNDVLFMKNWYSQIRYYMDAFDLDSASPWCPVKQHGVNDRAQAMILNYPRYSVIEGHDPVVTFMGWGWIMKKEILEKFIPFDEDMKFWFQDNHLGLQLKTNGYKHGCVTSSEVIHFGQRSYPLIPADKLHGMTMGIYDAFVQKWAHLK